MQTAKEALLAAFKGEMPEFIPPKQYTYTGIVFPGDRYFGPEKTGFDAWGTNWTNLGPDPGLDGSMVSMGAELFDDVTEWKAYVKFPDFEENHFREILEAMMQGMEDRETHVTHVLFLSGCWERMHHLMGMEDGLCAFLEEPEATKELLEAICDYKLKCIELAREVVDPDVYHMHDDWGTAKNLFFDPETWREFIKPLEKKITDKIHSYGKIYAHHSCGYVQTIIPDLVEIGVDAIDPLNVCNDVAWIKKNYGDKITLCGGVDNQRIDQDGVPEEEIRAEVRRVMDAYAPGGRYIPEFIFTNAERRAIFMDEVEKYGRTIYQK